MKWTLLVPGALLPQSLAPEIVRAIHAPRLANRLRGARLQSEFGASERSAGAAHWSWLAHTFGLPTDPPVTGPYAWHAHAGPGDEVGDPAWIAHCDPVHMLIARDHLVITDLSEAPLRDDEARSLLELANEAARPRATSTPDLRFAIRNGAWFVLSDSPLQLECLSLDAVLGRPLQERLPVGAHARALRILTNEIQMLWHASDVNSAREERGERTVNALWIHGGGAWQALPPRGMDVLRTGARDGDDAVLRGWLQAGAGAAANGVDRSGAGLSLYRGLFPPYAHQAWDPWLAQLPALEERVELELAEAQKQGVAQLELVLCGERKARTFTLALRTPWWQRLSLGGARSPASTWLRCLAETPAPEFGGAGPLRSS